MEVHVVCPNCMVGHEVPFDTKNDRPKMGFICNRCMTKIT